MLARAFPITKMRCTILLPPWTYPLLAAGEHGIFRHCIKSRADALANLPDPGKVAPRKRDVA